MGIPAEEAEMDDELEDLIDEVLQQQTAPTLYATCVISSAAAFPFPIDAAAS